MREEFEKLPEIANILQSEYWDFIDDDYLIYHDNELCLYVQGAWYAYQEQQKKIEQLLEIINTGLKIERNMNNQIHSLKEKIDTVVEYLDSNEGLLRYEQIKDILK